MNTSDILGNLFSGDSRQQFESGFPLGSYTTHRNKVLQDTKDFIAEIPKYQEGVILRLIFDNTQHINSQYLQRIDSPKANVFTMISSVTSEGNAQYTFDPYIPLEDIKVPDDINEFDWSSDLKRIFEEEFGRIFNYLDNHESIRKLEENLVELIQKTNNLKPGDSKIRTEIKKI
jgi:hypothetical protein